MIKNKSRITIKKLKAFDLPPDSNLQFQTIDRILNSLFTKDMRDAEEELIHMVQDEFNLSEKCAKQYVQTRFNIVIQQQPPTGLEYRYDIPEIDIIAVRKSSEEILHPLNGSLSKDCEKQLRDNNI